MIKVILNGPHHPRSEFTLQKNPTKVGRTPDNDIRILDTQASRAHLEIAWSGDAVTVKDLGSSNGTTFKAGRMKGSVPAAHGDIFTIGATTIQILTSDAPVGQPTDDGGVEVGDPFGDEMSIDATPGVGTDRKTAVGIATTVKSPSASNADPSEGLHLRITHAGAQHSLFALALDGSWTIGRKKDNALALVHESVSGHHGMISGDGTRLQFRDTGSTNGSFHMGQKITEIELRRGMTIDVGQFQLSLVDPKSELQAGPAEDDVLPASHYKRKSRVNANGLALVVLLVFAAAAGWFIANLPGPERSEDKRDSAPTRIAGSLLGAKGDTSFESIPGSAWQIDDESIGQFNATAAEDAHSGQHACRLTRFAAPDSEPTDRAQVRWAAPLEGIAAGSSYEFKGFALVRDNKAIAVLFIEWLNKDAESLGYSLSDPITYATSSGKYRAFASTPVVAPAGTASAEFGCAVLVW
jgi:pSer/pThr/pTyr-binding forkhead associated (FHA) protein